MTENLFSAAPVHIENQLRTGSEPGASDWVLQIRLSLIERGDRELLRHAAVSKTGDLGKDKPDPVAGLSPGPQFSEDCVIYPPLRVEKAVKVVIVGHILCVSGMFLPGRYQA